jgi:hypothetical protein
MSDEPDIAVTIVALLLVLVGYFLPWLIAVMRDTNNKGTVFFVNLFFGGTGVGWFVALIFAFTAGKQEE